MSYPIAIGALGGSGTRAVATLFSAAGYFMGTELNRASDTLLFTRLFKDNLWYAKADAHTIRKRLIAFAHIMSGQKPSGRDILLLCSAMKRNRFYKTDLATTTTYARQWLTQKPQPPHAWGFKEPNTQIYAAHILETIPNIRFIYVMRHGLDMAFSPNKNQLHLWGKLAGIPLTGKESEAEMAVKQLDFWIHSTKKITVLCQQFPDRVYLLNLTHLCQNPREEIADLLRFAGLPADENLLQKLAGIPKLPASHLRFKNHDLRIFREDQLAFVTKADFPLT